jgi:hypothetical protein
MNNLNPSKANTKVCCRCKQQKFISEFYKNKNKKDGLRYECKKCSHLYSNQLYVKNYNYYSKKRIKNRLKIIEYAKQYRNKNENKSKIKQYSEKYKLQNPDKIRKCNRQYYLKNKNKFKQKNKQYRLKKIDKLNQYNKQYRINNKEKIIKQHNQYTRRRRQTDINFKILCSCRARINQALKNNYKFSHTQNLIMCSISELKLHLEKQWLPGMTWDNYGYGNDKWNIDHIIPCSFFNLIDPVEQYMCFMCKNCQPLWQPDNFEKHNKIISI